MPDLIVDGATSKPRAGQRSGREAAIVRPEDPAFLFEEYAITIHVAAAAAEFAEVQVEDQGARALASFERDMLLYVYRDDPPLRTRIVAPSEPVRIHFPLSVEYDSEGRRMELRRARDAGTTRLVTLTGLQTYFPASRRSILHLVLTPLANQPETGLDENDELSPTAGLTEYDIIRLAKLWEGGEGLPERGTSADLELVQFSRQPQERCLGFPDLLAEVFPGARLLHYRAEQAGARPGHVTEPPLPSPAYWTGTIEVTSPLPAAGDKGLVAAIETLREATASAPKPEVGQEEWRHVVAVGGLLQGLLDFEEITSAELRDVFQGVRLDSDHLLGIHKGTLLYLSLAPEEEGQESGGNTSSREPPVPGDPYLLIPQAVLLHNEERLRSALAAALDLPAGRMDILGPQRRKLNRFQRLRVLIDRLVLEEEGGPKIEHHRRSASAETVSHETARARTRERWRNATDPLRIAVVGEVEVRQGDRFRAPMNVAETLEDLRVASRIFADRLPAVFHYPTERWVLDKGEQSRGLDEYQTLVERRLEDVTNDAESRLKRRDASTIVLAVAFPVLSALQAAVSETTSWVPAWIFPIAAVIVILAFILWRVRL